MATLHVLRVFTGATGTHGNPLGVFLDGDDVPEARRQAVAHDLGFAESVFVDDPGRGVIRIFAPEIEMPFAGHPTVGTAWLLAREGMAVATLHPPAGELSVREEGELTWVSARAEWSPPFDYVEYESAAQVEALEPTATLQYAWAWQDEDAGRIRARSFVPEAGIAEDEATGSAALTLAARLDREIEVHQGQGSVLYARALGGGRAEVGGRVVLDESRAYRVPTS